MSHQAGIWIDHKKAVIVTIKNGQIGTSTLVSDVGPHAHYSGSQEGGGEKKYEERHARNLDRYYEEVIARLDEPDELLLFGPGEAKTELKGRIGRSKALADSAISVMNSDKLTEPQIIATVKEHYEAAR